VVSGAGCAGVVQPHCQVADDVPAALGSVGAWPVVQFQFQIQGVSSSGTVTCLALPPMTTETTMLVGVVVVDTVAAPFACAEFSWVGRPSGP
jgi:hypothetical protein